MKKFLSVIIFLFFVSINCSTYCAPKYLSDGNSKIVPPSPIYKKTIIVPQGQILTIDIQNEISSSIAMPIDKVEAVLKNDFLYNGKMIAQEGSKVIGMVTRVALPFKEKPAELMIKFTNIITPKGENIPISAIFYTPDNTGKIYGEGTNAANVQPISYDIIIKQPVTYTPR